MRGRLAVSTLVTAAENKPVAEQGAPGDSDRGAWPPPSSKLPLVRRLRPSLCISNRSLPYMHLTPESLTAALLSRSPLLAHKPRWS